jgi:hypothetical protein
MTEDNPFDIRILDPKAVRVFRTSPDDVTLRLTLEGDRSWREARIARAFPFSDPDHYLGFRDSNDVDIGLVIEPRELDSESQRVIAEELTQRYFTPQIQRVISVKEGNGTVDWEVETDHGPRRILVRNLRDSTFSLGPARLMMTDTDGNRYEFPDVARIGAKAYQVLAKVL